MKRRRWIFLSTAIGGAALLVTGIAAVKQSPDVQKVTSVNIAPAKALVVMPSATIILNIIFLMNLLLSNSNAKILRFSKKEGNLCLGADPAG